MNIFLFNILFTVFICITITFFAHIIMSKYEKKIDFHGYKKANKHLNHIDSLIKDAKNEKIFLDMLVNIKNCLAKLNIEDNILNNNIIKTNNRLNKIADEIDKQFLLYKTIFPRFCPSL